MTLLDREAFIAEFLALDAFGMSWKDTINSPHHAMVGFSINYQFCDAHQLVKDAIAMLVLQTLYQSNELAKGAQQVREP